MDRFIEEKYQSKDIKVDLKKNKKNSHTKSKIRIAILGGSTTDLIKNNLNEYLKINNIEGIFFQGEYNQFYFESINPSQKLKKFKPQIIYIHSTTANIEEFPIVGSNAKQVTKLINKTFNKYKSIWNSLTKKFNCTIIQNNFEYMPFSSLGNLESTKIYGKINFLTKLNLKFFEQSSVMKNLIINDINLLSAKIGIDKWYNDSFYFNYKYALSHEAIPILSHSILKIIISIIGKSKKCLVVDFDNTIWGGIVGEVGPDNIEIGNNSPVGEIFLRFQKYIYDLTTKGVILAGCSKNDHKNAISGLHNKSNILKEGDFSIIKANWKNKVENILSISKLLNIGLDSIVFVDDSKFERELVRSQLPMVEVPNIGNEPEKYIFHIDRAKYFENVSLSKEDLTRSSYYKTNIKRETEKVKYSNYNSYLSSLKMETNLKWFEKKNINRITQLINKTNQFNLTSKRLRMEEVIKISKTSNFFAISGDLKDKFGDNGLVTVLIGKKKNKKLEIIIWLMSCRVFSRNLEFAMFDYLVKLCKKNKISNIHGNYIKSEKNFIVKDFFKTLNFKKIKNGKNNTKWEFKIGNKYTNKNKIIKIKNEK
jgi:FkbH-like protein